MISLERPAAARFFQSLRPILAAVSLCALLSACTAPAPWSDPPAKAGRSAVSPIPCPQIAGTFFDESEAGNACSALDEKACRSLSFYWFSAHVPEARGVSNFPTPSDDWPSGVLVRIEQPTVDSLRISTLGPPAAGTSPVLASRVLDRTKGDFECTGSALRLKPRVERDAQLWMGRRTNTEYLAVSIDRDVLVIDSTRHYETYLLWVVGGTMRDEKSTLRWKSEK